MTDGERATYTERQALKTKLMWARRRLVDAALDQPQPTPELRDAVGAYLALEQSIKRLG